MPDKVIVKTYKGKQEVATAAFQTDAAVMAAQGYVPVSQTWAPGSYGCGAFLFAALLIVVFVGILVFIYMLIVKPPGTLTVTYEYRGAQKSSRRSPKRSARGARRRSKRLRPCVDTAAMSFRKWMWADRPLLL